MMIFWILIISLVGLAICFWYIRKNTIKFPSDGSCHFANVVIIDSEKTLEKYLKTTNTGNLEELAGYYEKFGIFVIDRR